MSGHGSWTKVTFLKDKFNEILVGTVEIHKQIMKLFDESNLNENEGWIEDVTCNADTCSSDVREYLDSRTDEPPSEVSSVALWFNRCANEDITTEARSVNIPEKK